MPKDNSKKYPESLIIDVDGTKLVGQLRTFNTGSVGYYISGKVQMGEEKLQISCNAVIVGTKPEATEKKGSKK